MEKAFQWLLIHLRVCDLWTASRLSLQPLFRGGFSTISSSQALRSSEAGSPCCQTHVYFSREQVILTNEQTLWEERNFLRSSSGLTEQVWYSCMKYLASGNTTLWTEVALIFSGFICNLSSKGSIKLCDALKGCSTSEWPFHFKHHRPLPTGMDSFFPLLFLQEVIMCLRLQQFL